MPRKLLAQLDADIRKAQSREHDTGRYAHDNMDIMCVCGHTLGVHTAGSSSGFRPCISGDFAPHVPCDCVKFKKQRPKKPKTL